ncbi:MAG: hypothetical protein ABJO41_03705 [Erythrobacter sp.]
MGTRFFISADELSEGERGGPSVARSLQVLALVQQLINLQKSADALPASISVTALE